MLVAAENMTETCYKNKQQNTHTWWKLPSRLLIINKLKVYSTQALITVEISGNPTGMSINVNFPWKIDFKITKFGDHWAKYNICLWDVGVESWIKWKCTRNMYLSTVLSKCIWNVFAKCRRAAAETDNTCDSSVRLRERWWWWFVPGVRQAVMQSCWAHTERETTPLACTTRYTRKDFSCRVMRISLCTG